MHRHGPRAIAFVRCLPLVALGACQCGEAGLEWLESERRGARSLSAPSVRAAAHSRVSRPERRATDVAAPRLALSEAAAGSSVPESRAGRAAAGDATVAAAFATRRNLQQADTREALAASRALDPQEGNGQIEVAPSGRNESPASVPLNVPPAAPAAPASRGAGASADEPAPDAAQESHAASTPSTSDTAELSPSAATASASPFTVSVGATTMYQTLFGAERGNDALVGYLDILAEAEVAAGTTATLELESVGGDGPDADVPSFASTVLGWNSNAGTAQDDDGFDRVYLAEAFLSTDVLGHDWVLDFGKIASTGYLDTNRVANDSTAQFLSGAFVNSAATQIPFRGPGVALTWLGSERCDVRLLALRPDNSGDDATSGVFGAGQFDCFWRSANEREGSCGVYVFANGAKDDQVGAGLTFDQDCGDSCTAFARFGWQDEVSVSPQDVETAWSLGCEWRAPFRGRVDDVLGVAFGVNTSHDAALDDETVYEAYYKRVFSERVHASFHAQGMNHPGGDPTEDQVTSLGVRLQINL